MDKIYTFPNTEEARQKSIKTLESLLNIYQGTLFEHLLPLFVVGTLFAEPNMTAALERIDTINKILAKSIRELRKRAKCLPKKRKTTYKTIRKNCAKRNK